MSAIFQPFTLKNSTIKNRIVFPPIVCFHYSGDDGKVTNMNLDHYREVAEGGAGIIITEATAVWRDGRLAPFQLGMWSDEHIAGMANIAQIVSSAGALSLLQIHHAGLVTPESVHPVAKAPSADPANPRSVSMEPDEIVALRDAFIAAAVRAKLAGYHGVELHGAHGYLLNQFASSLFNKRDDDYGGTPGKNLRLASEIIHGIRQSCGPEFMIGYRMGANSPTLDDGIRVANILQEAGIDILHVSHGGSLQNIPRPPRDFPFNWIVYSGTVIRKSVQIPVIVVNEIKTPERANWLIENDLTDFIALGRPQLADPAWVNKVKTGILPNHCLSCKPKCRWYENSQLCPARRNASDIQPELS